MTALLKEAQVQFPDLGGFHALDYTNTPSPRQSRPRRARRGQQRRGSRRFTARKPVRFWAECPSSLRAMNTQAEPQLDATEPQYEALADVLRVAYHATHRGKFDEARRVLREAVRGLQDPTLRCLSVDQDILETYLAWVEEVAHVFYEGPGNPDPRPIRA